MYDDEAPAVFEEFVAPLHCHQAGFATRLELVHERAAIVTRKLFLLLRHTKPLFGIDICTAPPRTLSLCTSEPPLLPVRMGSRPNSFCRKMLIMWIMPV